MKRALGQFKQHWPYAVLLMVGLAAVAVVASSLLRPTEPFYEGTPLSYWSKEARRPNGNRGGAFRAVHSIGSPAVPFLLEELRTQNSASRRVYQAVYSLLPSALQKRMSPPTPRDELLFFWISELLSRSATLVQLSDALKDADTDVRLSATWALLSRRHTRESAIPLAVGLLKDRNREIRVSAALGLGQITSNKFEVVPILVTGLQGVGLRAVLRDNVQLNAPEVLGRMGPSAAAAVPELTKLLNQPQALVRVSAGMALWRIARAPDAITVLTTELEKASKSKQPEDVWLCIGILSGLAEIGPAARPAAEVIQNLIEFPRRSWSREQRSRILTDAREALKKIDPELESRTRTYPLP